MVGYSVLLFGENVVLGGDYDDLVSTVANAREHTGRVAIHAAVVALMVTFLGWWRPVLYDETRLLGGWFPTSTWWRF